MRIYRICTDLTDGSAARLYAPTFASAKLLAKLYAPFHETATVDYFEQPTDLRSIVLLLNGATPEVGNSIRAWKITPRGALRRLSGEELDELNSEAT